MCRLLKTLQSAREEFFKYFIKKKTHLKKNLGLTASKTNRHRQTHTYTLTKFSNKLNSNSQNKTKQITTNALPGKTLGGDGVGTAMGTPTLPLPLFSRLLLRLLGWLPPLLPLLLKEEEPPKNEYAEHNTRIPVYFWNGHSYKKHNSKRLPFQIGIP